VVLFLVVDASAVVVAQLLDAEFISTMTNSIPWILLLLSLFNPSSPRSCLAC
jgi:hypothetical protein